MGPQEEFNADDWVSLHEASDLLGVATSTVRRWGDRGRVPVMRTLGGHRRFHKATLEQLAQAQRPAPLVADISPTRSWSIDPQELFRQDWHTRFAATPATATMRGLGQRLLGMLMQYINMPSADERLLQEAHVVGETYGAASSANGVPLISTIEAFLYFRQAFARLARPSSADAPPKLAEVIQLRTRLDAFMDEILLGTIAGYEQGRASAQE